ncbi:hypothetical protein SAMN05444722_0171 [Rhodovulum sp. ES.010]|uniref:hypothetical protein n=1 Tax=Rhodovulum sp. ES.010 TaxID=1882821 RepID=UPI00092AEE56|nr:hypothetical protein [Rhodovulum sp. ES.010]SIO03037.1 hypothetical protein SAMN05444722_0171 [Rhodovulum sp. ES.010]
MTAASLADGPDAKALEALLAGLGDELLHAAELLRRYERAVLSHKAVADVAPGGARELQLVDLVIQILEDLGPLSQAMAAAAPPDASVPAELVDRLRLDQLRAVLGGATPRETPHSGGHIDFF